MDGQVFVSGDWASLVDWLTDDVDDSAESWWSDWHKNGSSSVCDLLASNESFGGVHCNGSHVVATEMLGDLKDKPVIGTLDLEGIENWRKVTLELHVDDGTNDLGNLTLANSCTEAAYTRESVMIS